MDTSSSSTVDITENQTLKPINQIKFIGKKKPCTLKIFNYLQHNYEIINPIQEVMNFVTEDEVIIYLANSEDESNDLRRTATSAKSIRPEITMQVVNMRTTQEPQESDINVTKVQLQSLENKLLGKILTFKTYFMDEILSLENEIKAYKINDNGQELSSKKSEDLILLRERVKYLESENKFLKDDIFN